MTDSRMIFEENNAPAVAAQRARGLADWLRTCVGLAVPISSVAPGGTSRQHLHDEQRPSPPRHEVRDPEDDVRQHFHDSLKHIMRQGPLGTDFVLCAVGRMAEDILRAGEHTDENTHFAIEWVEYARWVLPGFNATVAQ
jgi:hypothetical protein